MAKLVHSMIRVMDASRSVAFYEKAFGLSVVDKLDFESFVLIYMVSEWSAFELELTVNKSRTEPYDIGDGYGHLAVVVDNLEAVHERVIKAGASPKDIVDFQPDGKRLARFFFVADPDGYQIEVIEKGGRFK